MRGSRTPPSGERCHHFVIPLVSRRLARMLTELEWGLTVRMMTVKSP